MNKWMKWLLMFMFFAILKKVLLIFIINIENKNNIFLKEFQNNTLIIKMGYYKINLHILKI